LTDASDDDVAAEKLLDSPRSGSNGSME